LSEKNSEGWASGVSQIQVTEVALAFLKLSQHQIVFEGIGIKNRQVVAVGNNARPP
jgi:hypothetical protein